MRKQTKLVAVLSAAALLAVGASMTSFAGWEKDEDGIWHYYDSDDEMVEDEWRKDGSKWFYLDEDGNMLTDSWVDDEYYVGSDGAMLKNAWIKTTADDEISDPEDDGDHWYYFNSNGKKVTDDSKKINGRTYYFDEDGEMQYGWYVDPDNDDSVYYLGEEDEGWRAESQWLWLERPGSFADDDDNQADAADALGCVDDSDDMCDDEGWYYFGSNGKLYKDADKKKVNGKYYYFNEHGQMLYEWINDMKVAAPGSNSNAMLDGNAATPGIAQVDHMLYTNVVEDGSRADGWYEIDGSEDTETDGDTDWYFFDDGEAEKADMNDDIANGLTDGGEPVYRARIKVDSAKGKKYFCFNEYGQMQTGLQYIPDDDAFYYFDDNGYVQTGKVSDVECEDDDYDFYFDTSNGKNGRGVDGEKSNYLYFKGKKLAADDDYRLFYWDGGIYLVNNKGKIQGSNKKYDVENDGISQDDVYVAFNSNDTVKYINLDGEKETDDETIYAQELLNKALAIDEKTEGGTTIEPVDGEYSDEWVTIPSIELLDNVYTYSFSTSAESDGTVNVDMKAINPRWF